VIKEAVDTFWQSGWDFFASHFYVSPFWGWLILGAGVVAFFTALGWYFSFMRPIAGVVFVAVASALFGYREGEHDAEKHAEKPTEKKAPPSEPYDNRRW
jgi:hypothetical protein